MLRGRFWATSYRLLLRLRWEKSSFSTRTRLESWTFSRLTNNYPCRFALRLVRVRSSSEHNDRNTRTIHPHHKLHNLHSPKHINLRILLPKRPPLNCRVVRTSIRFDWVRCWLENSLHTNPQLHQHHSNYYNLQRGRRTCLGTFPPSILPTPTAPLRSNLLDSLTHYSFIFCTSRML